jgi:DnaK suppressor protein
MDRKRKSPERGPLTEAQRQALRQALQKKRDEILRNNRLITAATQSDDVLVEEMEAAKRASDVEEMLGLADKERELLLEIEHALAKFDDGTYGLSEASGEPIPFARLKAIPWARLDVQELEEAEGAPRRRR